MIKVAILVPMRGTVPVTFMTSYIYRISELSSLGFELLLAFNDDLPLEAARQRLFERAVLSGCDAIISLDSDMVIPRGVLPALLSSPYEMASALYFDKNPPHDAVILTHDESGRLCKAVLPDRPNPIQLVEATGLGCCAIKTSFLSRIEKPWFKYQWDQDEPMGEDVYFCRKLRSAGGRIAVYVNLVVGHSGGVFPRIRAED